MKPATYHQPNAETTNSAEPIKRKLKIMNLRKQINDIQKKQPFFIKSHQACQD